MKETVNQVMHRWYKLFKNHTNQEPDKELAKQYYRATERYDPRTLEAALQLIFDRDESPHMPTVANIHEAVQVVSRQQAAEPTWNAGNFNCERITALYHTDTDTFYSGEWPPYGGPEAWRTVGEGAYATRVDKTFAPPEGWELVEVKKWNHPAGGIAWDWRRVAGLGKQEG